MAPEQPDPVWIAYEGGLYEFGHAGDGFAFDNEGPRHKSWLEPFALASRPVTNAQYLAFIEAGGYEQAQHWLSEGWERMQAEGRRHPFYWRHGESGWTQFTLHGERPLHTDAPVCHLDYYEASAFASWRVGIACLRSASGNTRRENWIRAMGAGQTRRACWSLQ